MKDYVTWSYKNWRNRLVDVCDEDDLNVDGKIVFPNQEIMVKKGLERQYGENILLHEIIHGIFEFCGWEQLQQKNEKLKQTIASIQEAVTPVQNTAGPADTNNVTVQASSIILMPGH